MNSTPDTARPPRPRRKARAVICAAMATGAAAGLFALCFQRQQSPPSSAGAAIVQSSDPGGRGIPATAAVPAVRREPASPVVRTLLDTTPPPGAQSDYPLGVNPEPPAGKITLTTDTPRRLAFPSASAGGIFPARVRLLEMPDGKHRRLRVEEVWSERNRRELMARHTMVGDHLLVSAAAGVDGARLRAALPAGFTIRRTLRGSGALLVSFAVEDEDSLPAARVALEKLGPSLVQRVEPDTFVHTASIPNDPLFPEQWGLHNTGQDGGTPDADVDGPEAWDIRTDAAAFPIAVIDTGIDYTHPDLDANIWMNAGETGTDGKGRDKRSNNIDDDGNGYVDDWRGWDFANDDNDPMDDNGHGTHIAGIIGAEGNNGIGIAGVCWSCRMMPLKALTGSGGGAWSDIIEAVAYAKAMKAIVGNLSFGAYGAAPEEVKTTFAAANETLWCAAAGNGELPHNGNLTGDDLDEFHFFPACHELGNLISVTATGRNDALASFANYGRFMVDIAAPGVAIRSTAAGGGYGLNSGSSMSCAYVSGFCALAWPLRLQPYPINVRQLALTTVKRSQVLRNKLVTRGRLDASLYLAMAKSRMEWQMNAWAGDNDPDDGDESLGHCLQLRPDGTVMAWGNRAVATGGAGSGAYLTSPVEITLPTDARSVHANRWECFAVLSDGAVWTWGLAGLPRPVPIGDVLHLVSDYSGWKKALKNDGSVWSWPLHLHSPVLPSDVRPIAISGRVRQIGDYYLMDDIGRLHTWRGENDLWGFDVPAPVEGFPLLDHFSEISWNAVIGKTPDGSAWGFGFKSTLGLLPFDAATPDIVTDSPVRLLHWDGYLNAWAAPGGGMFATMPNGKVLYSGEVRGNFLGTNPVPPPVANPPYEVGGISDMVDFTGLDDADERAYALNKFGEVFRWDIERYRPEFAPITPMQEFSGSQISKLRLANGVLEGLILMAADFRGLCYGYNLAGTAGIGVDTIKARPIELPALRGARQILFGLGTWAVMPDGMLHSWGMRDYYVRTESGYHHNTVIPTPAGRAVRAVAGGFLIMEDGTLWQMEFDEGLLVTGYLQIPTSSPAVKFVSESWPVRVVLTNGTTIHRPEGSAEFVMVTDDFVAFTERAALKADGTVWGLEEGVYSQAKGFSDIIEIDGWFPTLSSHGFFVALRKDGRVFVLGSMGINQSILGDGQIHPPLSSPVMVEALTNIVQVRAFFGNVFALRADGEVFAWGSNDFGELGVGHTNAELNVVQPYGLSDVVEIWVSGGRAASIIAKRTDGSFWGWGYNYIGELTDGSTMIFGAPTLAYGYSGTIFNAGNGFEDWLTTYFNEQELRDIELFADVKDPDDDGLANLLEYALGTNPRKRTIPVTVTGGQPVPPATDTVEYTTYVPTAKLEKVRRNYYSNSVGIAGAGEGNPDEVTSHLVMTVPRAERRSDVDYIVEVSDDMEHWHFGPGHTVEVMNTLTNLVVYDARPFEESRRRFIRLRLVRNNPGQTSIPR